MSAGTFRTQLGQSSEAAQKSIPHGSSDFGEECLIKAGHKIAKQLTEWSETP